VLPELSPIFSSLARMTSTDSRERRAAASELATQLKGKRLSALLQHRLSQVVKAENDAIVWQTVLAAVASDPSQTTAQLAYMAIGHASSEVRRRACEYLQTHSDKCHLQALLPVLEDPNVTVAIAAVRAIGAAGVGDPEPLVRLLNVPDKQLRLETAMALARSKIEAGFAGIERLSRDTDFEIRRAAAVAMGEVGDEVFVPALIILIEDRRDIQVAALSSLAKIAGHDVVQEDELSVLPDEQVRRWKRWHADNTAGSEKGEASQSSHSVEIESGR
jgi:HEAT repeat protein